jgi:hypothetical protein
VYASGVGKFCWPAMSLIDSILESDRKAPRKQRHTARRIYDRIRAEIPGCTPAERTVRQYVERRKHALGLAEHETFVPQSYGWGVEAQVDWYEAYADLGGERIKLQVFAMRSMASGAAFHRAYLRATQQAFLEAHELAFDYFEGVFRRLRYDNLSSVVKNCPGRKGIHECCCFVSPWGHTEMCSEPSLGCQMREYLSWSVEISCHNWGSGFTDTEPASGSPFGNQSRLPQLSGSGLHPVPDATAADEIAAVRPRETIPIAPKAPA